MGGAEYRTVPSASDSAPYDAGGGLVTLLSTTAPNLITKVFSDIDDYDENATDYSSSYGDWEVTPYQKMISIVFLTVYGFIIAVGLVGNALVIFSILRNVSRISFTSMMLCSLAIADLLFVAVFTPINLHNQYHYWQFGPVACRIISMLWFFSPATSSMMLMVISAERYLVIIHPLQAKALFTKKRGLIIVGITWVISILLSLVSIPFTQYDETVYGDEEIQLCNRKASSKTGAIIKLCFEFLVLYVIPITCMVFCNLRVIVTLYESSRITQSLQSVRSLKTNGNCSNSKTGSSAHLSNCVDSGVSTVGGATSEVTSGSRWSGESEKEKKHGGKRKNNVSSTLQQRKRVMLLLGILVVMYAVLWGPLMIRMIVVKFVKSSPVDQLLFMAFEVLAISNSALNPVVYALMSRSFRQIIKNAFTCFPCCKRSGAHGLKWRRNYQFMSTRDRCSSMSNSRDVTQVTNYSVRSVNADSVKRANGANPNGYIYVRHNNAP